MVLNFSNVLDVESSFTERESVFGCDNFLHAVPLVSSSPSAHKQLCEVKNRYKSEDVDSNI